MVLAGCTTNKHYKSTDSATGDVYYTRAFTDEDGKRVTPKKAGIVRFVKAVDGQRVQLHDPKVMSVTKQEYHSAVYGE